MQIVSSICIEYKSIDNWHIFTCADLPGLYVASADAEKAYNDVATSIEKILRLNYGIEGTAMPEKPVSEFLCRNHVDDTELPIAVSNRRFAVAASV